MDFIFIDAENDMAKVYSLSRGIMLQIPFNAYHNIESFTSSFNNESLAILSKYSYSSSTQYQVYQDNEEIFSFLKKANLEILDKIEPDIYSKILNDNNKKIFSYKLFCLYNKYKENISFRKKFYLKHWNKMI